MAWWDLRARMRGEPLWKVLGGRGPAVTVGADFGVQESIDVLLEKIDGAVRAGYTRVKLKYAPGWDLPVIEAVRRTFPDFVFHIDCNSAYRLDDLEMFRKLDRHNLAMIEQPLMHDDLIDHAKLQKAIGTPICLDESITSLDKARQAIEIGACRWINIKPIRVGGLTRRWRQRPVRKRRRAWGSAACSNRASARRMPGVATLANMKYPNDVSGSRSISAICEPESRFGAGADDDVERAASAFSGAGSTGPHDVEHVHWRRNHELARSLYRRRLDRRGRRTHHPQVILRRARRSHRSLPPPRPTSIAPFAPRAKRRRRALAAPWTRSNAGACSIPSREDARTHRGPFAGRHAQHRQSRSRHVGFDTPCAIDFLEVSRPPDKIAAGLGTLPDNVTMQFREPLA